MRILGESSVLPVRTSLKEKELDAATILLIAEQVRRILVFMGFDSMEVKCAVVNSGILQINIDAGGSGRLLIGSQGKHLIALQHIVRCILKRGVSKDVFISVDVNNYRARRESSLGSLAENVAGKAQRTGRAVVMEPMSAVDRRAVHAALVNRKDVKTESLGEGSERRVVVKPVFL